MLANLSYGKSLDGGFGYDRTGGTSKCLANKRESFTVDCAKRLQQVQIECCDALRIIQSRDTPETFVYCDPPYVGADQGHYDGYSQDDFNALLKLLESIKGKFLLSSYRNKALKEFIKQNNWYSFEVRMPCSMANRYDNRRDKVEVFTANYPIKAPDNKA